MITPHLDRGRTLDRRAMEIQWTPALIERLTALWTTEENGKPISTAEIGRRLGVSKNAVIGKVRRIGLPGRESPLASLSPTRSGAMGTGKKQPIPRAPKVTLPALKPRPRTIGTIQKPTMQALNGLMGAELDREEVGADDAISQGELWRTIRSAPVLSRALPRTTSCCFPIGEPRRPGFRFCEGVTVPGRPYCAEHVAVCYRPYEARREDAAA